MHHDEAVIRRALTTLLNVVEYCVNDDVKEIEILTEKIEIKMMKCCDNKVLEKWYS